MIQIKALAKYDNKSTTFFIPLESIIGDSKIKLNKYFGFNCWKHNEIKIGCKYELEIELYSDDVKYGATYKIISLTPIM